MRLIYQDRDGIDVDCELRPASLECRLTVPAREALEDAGVSIERVGTAKCGAPLYSVQLAADSRVPVGLVACEIVGSPDRAIRMVDEPEYPGEVEDYWTTLDFTPCPVCGRPLIWWEAGYVPGYRVCSGGEHHHVLAR